MNKTVIVTGAANGIGKAVAQLYAVNGFNVVIADMDKKAGLVFEKECIDNQLSAKFFYCDVSIPDSIHKLVENTIEYFDRIDIVINNAGVSEFISPFDLTVENWDRILNTNLRSCFLLTRDAAKHMQTTGGGCIINIASTRAFMSEINSEAYAASKGAIVALTHSMSLSLAEFKIRVNCVSPGWIHTGNYKNLRDIDHEQHPSKRVGKPEDIARACLFLSDPENGFINGENLIVDGGMTRKMIYEH